MLTWLDWYVRGAADLVGPLGRGMSDAEAMALIIAMSAKEGASESPADLVFLHAAIFPFLLPHLSPEVKAYMGGEVDVLLATSQLQGRGLQPSSDLVQALSDGSPGAEVSKSAVKALSSATHYIDLPHRSFLLSDDTQIRAIFVQPAPCGDFRYIAILTAPGGNKMTGRYAWIGGKEGEACGLSITLEVNAVRRPVENFVQLLVAYKEFASDLVATPLPRYSPRDLEDLPKKRRKLVRNRATLFQVSALHPPAGRFGRKRSESGGWKLTHQVQVRGHFRWQPYGPGREKRKLIWIAEHTRGGGKSKPILDKLDLM